MLDFGVFLESKPIMIGVIFFSASFIALWLVSIYWVYQDIFNRTKNSVLQILSIVLAILFPFFGLLMYSLIRPSLTMEERRMQILDEKIMRRQIGGLHLCSHCHKPIEENYLFCPYCNTKLKESCPKCDQAIDKKFSLCPFCGYELRAIKQRPTVEKQSTNSNAEKQASSQK